MIHCKHRLPDLLHGCEQRVYGDSAYASQKELIHSAAPKAKDFTNQRSRRAGVVVEAICAKNRNISKKSAHAWSMSLLWSSGCGDLARCDTADCKRMRHGYLLLWH